MKKNEKSIEEINKRITEGNVRVVTASEMIQIVTELGAEDTVHEVDVVTTGTFGAMCSSGVWMNFGHSEPPMKMSRVWLNDVEAYAGVAAVDAYLGATRPSETRGIEYGGGHVIEDLVNGRTVSLRAEGVGTDCYPLKHLSVDIGLMDLNQAVLSNPRNCYERYGVATNTSHRALNTYMGKLLPNLGNATYSGAGELSPIINDPMYRTIGIGTRILLGGAEGHVIGSGTQHNPIRGLGTLMVQGDLKEMCPSLVRGATMTGYGPTLYLGVGVPIPIINAEVARTTAISDAEILTSVFDYAVQSRERPILTKVSYQDLKSGTIDVNGREVPTSSLSSNKIAMNIAQYLKRLIERREFYLTQAVKQLSSITTVAPLKDHPKSESRVATQRLQQNSELYISRDEGACIHCGLCVPYCVAGVFKQQLDWTVTFEPELCIECDECRDICPQRALSTCG